MVKAKEVKKFAKKCGADLVGIASMDRFEGAPKQMDPRFIFPEAKALIVLGFRIPRGCFRGIEEGTYFGAYPSMGYGGINIVYAPIVLRELVCFLEDRGYEAVPYPNMCPAIAVNRTTGEMKKGWSRPVSVEKPAPDVFVHFRIAAFCAGLGESGIKETNPFLPEDADENAWNREWYGAKKFIKWYGAYGHNPAIEGGRGCIRACMIHLEKRGILKNKFKNPFRKRKPWVL